MQTAIKLPLLIATIVAVSHFRTADCAAKDVLLNAASNLHVQVQNHINKQKQVVGRLLNVDPDTKYSELFPSIAVVNKSQLNECFDSTIGDGNESFDLFNSNVFDSIKAYYKHFPENFQINKFPEKVKNLFKSITEISKHTMECIVKPTDYQLGLTQLTDYSDDEYKTLLGSKMDEDKQKVWNSYLERPPSSETSEEGHGLLSINKENEKNDESSSTSATTPKPDVTTKKSLLRFRRQKVTVDPICFPKNKDSLPEKFDWRSQEKVTPARFQGPCGSCWAFASLACLESAYLIKGRAVNREKFDLSEQQLLGCARKKGCDGGSSVDAFNYILVNGITDEKKIPYDFKKTKCESKNKKKVAVIKDYCLRGIYAKVDGKPENLTDQQLQYAIREFGPIYATINADHLAIKHHKHGVYKNDKCPKTTNHAITIVGWDRKGWIIKNSWGKKWGDKGFFRMKRGENLCGLNTYITYPIL